MQPSFYGLVSGRCSSKPQLDRYGPTVQLAQAEEGRKYFPKGELKLLPELSIFVQEPASGWNRKQWEQAMDQILQHYHQGTIQVAVFPRVNRETRFIAGSFGKLMEMVRSGLLIYFAQERLLLDPENTHSIQEYTIEAIKAQGFVDVLKRDCLPARADAARRGEIPSGFGRYGGCLGLRYDKQQKRFSHIPGIIDTAHEILMRYLDGESASSITVDLQRRGKVSASGGQFHRSAVNRVLAHAKVYTGILTWDGIEIRGKVEPIITGAQAEQILARLRWNKEKSLGFGKRKWLTGRVVCGVCGRRYSLDARKGCRCNANDPRAPTHCDSPRVSWKQLQDRVLDVVGHTIFSPRAIALKITNLRKEWELQQETLAKKSQGMNASLSELNTRRRLLCFQHEHKGLTDEEYLSRLQSVQREETSVLDALNRLSEFSKPSTGPLSTMTPTEYLNFRFQSGEYQEASDIIAKAEKMSCTSQEYIEPLMASQSDKDKDKLAEAMDLKTIVSPGHGNEPFSLELLMKLPLDEDSLQLQAGRAMVTPSSLRTEHHRHLSLLIKANSDRELAIESVLAGVV